VFAVIENIEFPTGIQTGVFSRAQALATGETDRTLADAVRRGQLVRLRRGMYVPGDLYQSCDDVGRHLLLARAAVAGQQGRVALTGISAAALHGFALYGVNLKVVHLVRLDGGSSRVAAGIHHHVVRGDLENDLPTFDGLLAVTPARAIWEVACRSSLETGVVAADSALKQSPQLAVQIEELAERFARFPGSCHGRQTVRLASPLSDSVGESVTRVQFFRYGVPQPDQQIEIVDAQGRRIGFVDFYWEDCRHVGEFDGKAKYEKYLRPGEKPSACVVREKRREDRIRAGRRGVSRFVWSDVMRPNVRRTMADLKIALAESRRLYVTVPTLGQRAP
jgi:hypothetical protein